jgi:deoxyribonuclease-4
MRIGAHVESKDPLAGARVRQADVVQINLSSPRMWAPPKPRADAGELASQSTHPGGVRIFTHAPYLINVASGNPELVALSLTCLRQQVDAAATIGASGVVVHAGHAPAGIAGRARAWVHALRGWVPAVPVLIENTAGGEHALARTFGDIATLYTTLQAELDPETYARVGFCLDTCHAHAGGLDLAGLVDRVRTVLPRIDLVHANDSRDSFGSRRDRHEHLGAGQIGLTAIAEVCAAADAPVIVETPGGSAAQAADIATLRRALTATGLISRAA